MPRRCHCARLLAMLERDALRLAGLAAQALFLRLMQRAHELGSDGFLPLGSGSGSGIGNLRELAFALTVSETELETQLGTLVTRGVLVREADGIACPELRAGAVKAAAARANGGVGGRPRRGETPAEARARRQGNLMLPMQGGKPTGTQVETQAGKPSTTSLIEKEKKVEDAREVSDLVALGGEVVEAAGLDPARWMGTYEPVRQWLALGLDRAAILDVVRTVRGRTRREITGLAYFTPAMREAASRAVEPAAPAWTQTPEYLAYRAAMDRFAAGPFEPEFNGRPPRVPDCVPRAAA